MMLKRLSITKEPKLKVHKYVVQVCKRFKKSPKYRSKFHYCVNLKEVKAVAKASEKGSWIMVYSATHNFIQGYAHE